MFKTQTIQEQEVISFEFNTNCGGKINVGIQYVDEDTRERFRQGCTESLKGKKFRFKNRVYKRMLAREAIVNIENATYQDISFIIEPTQKIVPDPGKTWKDLITYDDDVKEYVVMNMIEEFSDFIEEACTEVEVFHKKAKAKEMSNLKPGSGAPQES
jgi:hypothetical protein